MKILYVLLFSVVASFGLESTSSNVIIAEDGAKRPKVFQIWEEQEIFNQLSLEYGTSLLEAHNDDLYNAYGKWFNVMHDIEDYATKIDYNIYGVKSWIKIFWATDGTMQHIGFFIRPESRNIDVESFTAFLTSFVNQAKYEHKYKKKYSHYGAASFPTFPRRTQSN